VLIDEILNSMEKDEKNLKGLGWKDPEASRRDLLYKAKEQIWNKSNDLRTNLFFLDRKITNLILIVQRLRKELDLPPFEEPFRTKSLQYIEIDIESFFQSSYSLLNLVAGLTPHFYRHPIKGLPHKSFRKQRRWYIKHTDLDPKYSKYLKSETRWFDDFIVHRDKLAHLHPLVTFLTHDATVFFGTNRNEKGFIPNVNVGDFINSTANCILEFLIFYDNHFGKKPILHSD
jgi:hypothetical protein